LCGLFLICLKPIWVTYLNTCEGVGACYRSTHLLPHLSTKILICPSRLFWWDLEFSVPQLPYIFIFSSYYSLYLSHLCIWVTYVGRRKWHHTHALALSLQQSLTGQDSRQYMVNFNLSGRSKATDALLTVQLCNLFPVIQLPTFFKKVHQERQDSRNEEAASSSTASESFGRYPVWILAGKLIILTKEFQIMFLGNKVRLVCKADVTAIYEPTV
jgi:hypothetical protein